MNELDIRLQEFNQRQVAISTLNHILGELNAAQRDAWSELEKATAPTLLATGQNSALPGAPSDLSMVRSSCSFTRPTKHQRALIFKETLFPCRHYKDWLIRSCRQIREDYPNQWDAAVASLNSGCNATLRVAQSREALLPNLIADLRRVKTESIGGGWYVSKESLDKNRIEVLIKRLCDSTGLRFGVDVVLVESKG
jgi:hypothetical protein